MHRTLAVAARSVASTKHGMRRILKYKPDLVTYIEQSVNAGTYRSRAEIEAMHDSLTENPADITRLRWNVRRGSKVQDYPFEYHVLSAFPPPPKTPKMPVKYLRRKEKEQQKSNRPFEQYAERYLSRYKAGKSDPNTASIAAYDKLLGIGAPSRLDSAIASKSAMLQKAYAFAIKQFEVMRANPNLSEAEAIRQVEDLLRENDAEERRESRAKAEQVRKRREEFAAASAGQTSDDEHPRVKALRAAKGLYPKGMVVKRSKDNDPNKRPPKEGEVDLDDDNQYLAQLYSDDQRAFSGMIAWTYRLQAVPYSQWTVGASTALDHWIAKRVLGLSETTWMALIEGSDPKLLSRGRDIIMARHALFPETIVGDQSEREMAAEEAESEAGTDGSDTVDEIDKLLEALDWDEGSDSADSDGSSNSLGWGGDSLDDDKILALNKQLQTWRGKQEESPYDNWSKEQKNEFQMWLRGYVEALVPESSLGTVDLDSTRKSLLASPPLTKEDSDNFWNSIRDEAAAEEFLERLLEAGPPESLENATHAGKLFWEMPYEQQLEHLIGKGAIREILDEYASEKDRVKFWMRYGDYILEGLVIDHLVPDPDGPISASDLSKQVAKKFKVSPNQRFRIEQLPYGSKTLLSDSAERARTLFREWNKLKAGRAHYEERLFQRGMLGLRYTKKDVQPKKKKTDEFNRRWR